MLAECELKMPRPSKLAMWILGWVILLSGISLYVVAQPERDAKRLWQDARAMKFGSSSVEEVLRYGRGPRRLTDAFQPCQEESDSCDETIAVKNEWLNRLHLAPDVGFGVRFIFENHKLAAMNFVMGVVGNGLDRQVIVEDEPASPNKPAFVIRHFYQGESYGVEMTEDAPARLRQLAYEFNFHCLSGIGGCKTFEDMLPILGRKDLISSETGGSP